MIRSPRWNTSLVIGLAIIGAGRMGRRHLEVAQSLNLSIAGVCDVQQEALAAIAREYDAVHSVERAKRVGSIEEIIPAKTIRPYLIDTLRAIKTINLNLSKTELSPLQ